MQKKLFIPGPTEVNEKILKAMSAPMIGHRTPEFSELFKRIIEKLKKLMYTDSHIFISTSSGTGLLEGAVRNCVAKKCLSCSCGAFSDRWFEITKANGLQADELKVDWGKAIKPEMIDEKLKTGDYDTLCLTHNETSTGVMHNLEEISKVMKNYPDVVWMIDTVSSLAGVKIEVDRLGVDVCIASSQKCFAVPPGIAVCSVSEKAMERAKTIKHRGYYFDFVVLLKYIVEKNWQTPATPSISHLYALDMQMDDILAEGLDNRFKRHTEMAEITRKWGLEHFGELFSEDGYHSDTVTCITNTKKVSVKDLNSKLGQRGMAISNGYGKLKELTFRIGHMGDHSVDDIKCLLANMDEILAFKPSMVS